MTESAKERLERGVSMLVLIEKRRADNSAQTLGANIERLIIERELQELEEDWVQNDR